MSEEYSRETAAMDTVVPLSPTAGALTDILSKAAGARTFDKSTDSLEAIYDKVNAISVPVATTSGTTAGVVVQDGTSGTPNVVTVTPTTVNTFGSWAQLDASTSANSWISHVAVTLGGGAFPRNIALEIGTGAAASEVTKLRFSFRMDASVEVGYLIPIIFTLPIPVKVASGTRIAARCSDNSGNGLAMVVGLSMYQGLET